MIFKSGRRRAGQSLPLFALMMVFVVGMVGFSVDVGNAFSQERRMQNSANAAALAGMNTVIAANKGQGATNKQVWETIQKSTAGNRVNNKGNDYVYYVDYIVDNGGKTLERIPLADWNGSTQYITPGNAPKNIVRVQVTMEHRVPAYFTRVVGWNDFNVNVDGSSCLGGYGQGVLALGIPLKLEAEKNQQPYHRIVDVDGKTPLATNDPKWGDWDKMEGMTIHFPVENGTSGVPGTLIAWLSWTGSNSADDLRPAMTYPGTLQDGFVEAAPLDSNLPNSAPLKKLTLGDWVNGDTGKKATLKDELNILVKDGTEFSLPIYDRAAANGQSAFRVVRMGRFKMTAADINGNDPYFEVKYLGNKTYSATECVSPPPKIRTYKIKGKTRFDDVWGTNVDSNTTYDVVIVMDTSRSMSFDWNDRKPGWPGYKAENARILDAKKAVIDFVRGWDVESDPDARMAFVTFGGTSATKQVDWQTSGCPEPPEVDPVTLEPKPCSDAKKWATIQSKANAMVPAGNTPGPLAFEMVETLLQQKRTPADGRRYGQIVLFATDGVFNVCGAYTDTEAGVPEGRCTTPGATVDYDGTAPSNIGEAYYLYSAPYNAMPGRPIWQAQGITDRIKKTGARIFVVAVTPTCSADDLTCFSPQGLREMSSGATGYYYEANNPAQMARIYTTMRETIISEGCKPQVKPKRPVPGARILLQQPQNPTWYKEVTADSTGQWSFSDLKPGQYTVTVKPAFQHRGQDGITRTYSRVVNARNANEEGQASVNVNGRRPDGAVFTTGLDLTLPRNANGALENGCSVYETP